MKKFWLSQKAVAAVEFAILAPLFFLIFFGIIEVGLTMFADSTINSAMRAASRTGITQGFKDENAFRAEMRKYMGGIYRESGNGMEVAARIINCGGSSGNLSSISTAIKNESFFDSGFNINNCPQNGAMVVYGVKYKWGGITGLMSPFLPKNLYSITVVRNENF